MFLKHQVALFTSYQDTKVPGPWRLGRKDYCKFEANLGYTVNSGLACTTV